MFIDTVSVSTKKASTIFHVLVMAVTRKGHLNFYLHQIGSLSNSSQSSSKKPVKVLNQLKLLTNESKPLNILCSYLSNEKNERVNDIELEAIDQNSNLNEIFGDYFVNIVFGNELNPKIEKLV